MNKIKIPEIPPLLVDDIFETKFKIKARIFNSFFAKQCTILSNNSKLPIFDYKTNKRINDIKFEVSDILKIIKDLNPNKAHGHDGVSIKMIQMCDESITIPLELVFESAIRSGHFPDTWKKGIIIPVHKKESKNLVKNYRPISLLPVFGKMFEKIIYNNLYNYFQENQFLTEKQSGFGKGTAKF